jgi:hypothetical protein
MKVPMYTPQRSGRERERRYIRLFKVMKHGFTTIRRGAKPFPVVPLLSRDLNPGTHPGAARTPPL